METKQIIILIIIIGVYIFNMIRKAKAKAIENQKENTHEDSHDEELEEDFDPQYKPFQNYNEETYEAIDYSQLLKNRQIVAESLETITFETQNLEIEPPVKTTQKHTKNRLQKIDNEADNSDEISTDPDDIRKGIIYSEILNRKYN